MIKAHEPKESEAVPAKTETNETIEADLVEDGPDDAAADETSEAATAAESDAKRRPVNGVRVLAYGVLPGLALLLALTAGFLKWTDSSVRAADIAGIESLQAAKDSTVALLTYQPDTVDQQLGAARELTTGEFRDSYTSLVNDVVIPGAKQQRISAIATIPAAASVSADPDHAVALIFVNQSATVGTTTPSETASSVRVTMDKVDDRWLISGFDPI